jgi:hypothetical protein
MKFKPKDCTITIRLSGKDSMAGYLTLEGDNAFSRALLGYAVGELSELDGWVSDECFEHLKAAGVSSFDDLYTWEPNDLVTCELLTKDDLGELVECGVVELQFRKLEPKEEALPAKVTRIKKKGE